MELESVVLERRAGEPSRLLASRDSLLRARLPEDLVPKLERAVGRVRVLGSLDGPPFEPDTSSDLVLLAERET